MVTTVYYDHLSLAYNLSEMDFSLLVLCNNHNFLPQLSMLFLPKELIAGVINRDTEQLEVKNDQACKIDVSCGAGSD